jgi:hypothetical protein
MAINDQYKIDLAFKKLAYGVHATSTLKQGFEEGITSFVPTYDQDIWAEASLIPSPATVGGVVEKITLETLIEDVTVSGSVVFVSQYRDFIPPSFDPSYVVYIEDGNGNRVFPGSTSFFFDYISGTLVFPEGSSSYTSQGHIKPFKLTAFRYIGKKGLFVSSGAGSSKDIVFMIGDDILSGPQEHTEMIIPYTGTITKILASIGVETRNLNSNLIFNIQKFQNSQWVNTDLLEMGREERYREYELEIPIEQDRVRINLMTGNYANVKNMSIIARMNL